VLGSYDRRITFYSQQVRALSLVHALHMEGYLRADSRIAVIGGGAAGITAAAAAALVTQNEVVLFERHQELLPMQSATMRRNLDPHIFDWPEWDTDDPIADLPILDWKAGPAREVRVNVAFEFEGMVTALHPRLQKRMRHSVASITPVGTSYELMVERDARPGEDPGSRVIERDRFDIVLLAIGFGIEPAETLPGIPNHSYWSSS
jgi:flavin-dependent dehydrogenase